MNISLELLERIEDEIFTEKKIDFFIYKDYLNHPNISGNKLRKLKFNLKMAREMGYTELVSMGGAYSNHLYALAHAGKLYDFKTVGIVRGEQPSQKGYTLRSIETLGMKLEYVSREAFKKYRTNIDTLKEQYPSSYILPEGGTNELALLGFEELINEIKKEHDYLIVPVGSGGTLAGISKYNNGLNIGIAVVNDHSLKNSIAQLSQTNNFTINNQYTFGAYAKTNDELIHFINTFTAKHQIPLDPIYTGKMMYGIYDLAKKNFFKEGSVVIAIHTGGLQGINGYNESNPQNQILLCH